MHPLVLIKSFGAEGGDVIINEILRVNGDILDPLEIFLDSYILKAHKLCICTKYYKTNVLLFECDDIKAIPNAVKKKIEGAVFYFDSNNLSFLSEIDHLLEFVKDNNIEVSALITRNLNENCLPGLTYEDVKSKCKLEINVIDLNAQVDDDESAEYANVLELFKNHIWSNVNISTHNSNKIYKPEEYDTNVEEALNEFEELLNKFQQFKDVSRNLCREEIFQNAENLAEIFAKILNED